MVVEVIVVVEVAAVYGKQRSNSCKLHLTIDKISWGNDDMNAIVWYVSDNSINTLSQDSRVF